MNLISVLSGKGFVMYNKELAHKVSVNGSIIFGQLCSSYESFGSKEMLTVKDGKEYFFLTSETLEEETALTYKQQLKAAKELENAGYIETRVMGMPSKKYFHITDKIEKDLIGVSKSDKREDLNKAGNEGTERQKVTPSYDKREYLALPKGNGMPDQKGTLKINNKKEQYKNINDLFVNKESVNKDEIISRLINEYRLKGLSKEVCLRVVNEVMQNEEIENFPAYLRTCLENTLYKSRLKRGEIDLSEKLNQNNNSPLYNWLE
ncbi:hypothetical protein P4T04_15610 [Bacillus badius]|uniref:hypothetical protein n=1 Tax=Bacillus badius TaxID=1455 RepID=UPI002E1EA9B9|nr:hypothetical protein [Bacillus badius]